MILLKDPIKDPKGFSQRDACPCEIILPAKLLRISQGLWHKNP